MAEPVTGSKGLGEDNEARGHETGKTPPGQPWYRKPIISLTLGLFAAILLGVAIFILADKTGGNSSTTQTPTSPTMSVSTPAPATT